VQAAEPSSDVVALGRTRSLTGIEDVLAKPISVRFVDLPPLNSTTSRARIWGWSKPREATNATRKEGAG